MGNIFITGDTHGTFNRIKQFCEKFETTISDTMIILGDVGLNFWGDIRDTIQKEFVSKLPITLFCIHGNHENRAENLSCYHTVSMYSDAVLVDPQYPNIVFARDGGIYDFNGQKAVVIGGAYSVDKPTRIANGFGWWLDEQPSQLIKDRVEKHLENNGWKVDVVLSHTCPKKYEPIETFKTHIEGVDKSTEEWLDTIEDRLTYKEWYCGHYHINKSIDKINFLFELYMEI